MQRSSLRPFVLFAAAVLLLHTLLPFYATYQLPTQPGQSRLATTFGDKILICTAEGFRFVSLQDLLDGKEKPKPHKRYQCPVCYVITHGQGLTADGITIAAGIMSIGRAILPVWLSSAFTERDWQERLTRSPPSLLQ